MGKASKFKKLRRLAGELPCFNVRSVIGERVAGKKLIEAGVKEVEGKPVDPELDYKSKKEVPAPLNHFKKMKQIYNKRGLKGVQQYVNEAVHYANRRKAIS